MPFLDDLITLLETATVGTQNVNVFASAQAAIPKGNGPYLQVIETGGTSPEDIHNQVLPAYHKPTAQLTTRGVSYSSARSMLSNALNAVCIINQVVNGTLYQSIRPMQEIGDRGLDVLNRPTCGVNVIGEKA